MEKSLLVVGLVVAVVLVVIYLSNRYNKGRSSNGPVLPTTDDGSGDKPYDNGTKK